MNYVTFEVFKENEIILRRTQAMCFRPVNWFSDWDYIKVKINTRNSNLELEEWYLNKLKEIDPNLEIVDGWATVPNYKSKKTLFILTLLRYLWEDNGLNNIVHIFNNLSKDYSNIDTLQLLSIAALNNLRRYPFSLLAHLHVYSDNVNKLVTIEDYQNAEYMISVSAFSVDSSKEALLDGNEYNLESYNLDNLFKVFKKQIKYVN